MQQAKNNLDKILELSLLINHTSNLNTPNTPSRVTHTSMSSDGVNNNKADFSDALSSLNIKDVELLQCSNCGKESDGDSMNTCNKCGLVKYCNAACKKKHKSKHKKKCERRVAELYDEKLFKEPPPREECPICMLPLPLAARESTFQSCCGKHICSGCTDTMKEREGANILCAFCRTPYAESDEEEIVKRIMKLIQKDNAHAFFELAGCYAQGVMGIAQDRPKANELFLKAGELGCAAAYHNLGLSYYSGNGVDIDMKKAKHYYELAAMNGNVFARHNLGCMEVQADNQHRAMKHFMISARSGYDESLGTVKQGFMGGIVGKDEYANTLRAYQKSVDEMKSEARDKVKAIMGSSHYGATVWWKREKMTDKS